MAPIRKRTFTRDEAETLALEGLTFLASDETRLVAFLGATGLDPVAIRREASSPDFLAGILDFLMSDESLLLVFTSNRGLDPNLIALARRALMQNPGEEF